MEKKPPMDLELYRATVKGEPDNFIDVLTRISTEKGLPVAAILDQVTPRGNTFLHVAAACGRYYLAGRIAHSFPHLLVSRNRGGDTPFHVAARAGEKVTAWILSRFAEDSRSCRSGLAGEQPDLLLRMTNRVGNTALHEALIARHEGMVECLVPTDEEVPFYYANKEGKSPLYIAVESGDVRVVGRMLQIFSRSRNPTSTGKKIEGKSPIHAAIIARNKGMLELLLREMPMLVHSRGEDEGTVLHYAASVGYYKGVQCLLGKCIEFVLESDSNGLLPVHIASQKGHVEIVKKLLRECVDLKELLTTRGENILHVAAKCGKSNVVRHILETPELGMLINQKNDDGNTPLHLATRNWHPKVVSCLTWDSRTNLNFVNNKGMTALDVAEELMGISPSYRKRLTWIALKSGGGQPSNCPKSRKLTAQNSSNVVLQDPPPSMEGYKDRVNTLLLVATLVATVTFAAGFTMPGGYNNSSPNQGMATMLRKRAFQAFVICDTIAMYSSIIVAVALIWAQLGDINLVLSSIRLTLPLLGLALAMMASAFTAGVCLVIGQLGWLSHVIFIMGIVFLAVFLLIFIPLFFPNSSSNPVLRFLSYYFFFCLLMIASGSDADEKEEM